MTSHLLKSNAAMLYTTQVFGGLLKTKLLFCLSAFQFVSLSVCPKTLVQVLKTLVDVKPLNIRKFSSSAFGKKS